MNKLLNILFIITFLSTLSYGWEVKFKEKAQYYIVKGKIEKGTPQTYVTLDIQEDRVIYKQIENWKKNTVEKLDKSIFKIVSQDKGYVSKYKEFSLFNLKNQEEYDLQNIIRAVYAKERAINFLIIGENFLIEVKNSVLFGDAISYFYYERIN